MRNIDLKCPTCGHIVIDHFQRRSDEYLPYCRQRTEDPLVLCGTLYERVFLPTQRQNVISDECDVWVHHGICNDDGTPRHYNHKSEMRKVAESKGLVSHVVHESGSRGGDKSKHTSRWV